MKTQQMEIRVLVDGKLEAQQLFTMATKKEIEFVMNRVEQIAEAISMGELDD